MMEEIYIGNILSMLAATVGGLLWGMARGSLASARQRRPVYRSMLATAAGSIAFEGAMLLKSHLLFLYVDTVPAEAPGLAPPPSHYRTLVRYASYQVQRPLPALLQRCSPCRATPACLSRRA